MILFNAHVKTCVHCLSIPNDLKISGFIPSGPGDLFSLILFICCFTSCTVISGSSMYPVMLNIPALSKCSCKIVDICTPERGTQYPGYFIFNAIQIVYGYDPVATTNLYVYTFINMN